MPRTRMNKKQQSEDDEKKKHLEEYLTQFDLQLENEITRLNRQAECICNSVRTFFAVQRMGLDKNLLEISFKDFIENQKEKNKSSSEIRSTKQNSKKKNVHSILKAKSTSKKRLRNDTTPKNNRILNPNVFTPKFDPRKPITPAVGLRSIKPGEKFILMSAAGSPLSGSPVTELVADADGKTIHVTTDMPVPDDVDEDTKHKICMIQKTLTKKHTL